MALSALSTSLDEYGSRLNFSSASKVLIDANSAETFMGYMNGAGYSSPHTPQLTIIDINADSLATIESRVLNDRDWNTVKFIQFDGRTLAQTRFETDVFTHVVFDLTSGSNKELSPDERLEFLKHVQYILQPKGIAILVFAGPDFDQTDEVKDLLENAVFERGRMRVLDHTACWVAIVMKWDLLYA